MYLVYCKGLNSWTFKAEHMASCPLTKNRLNSYSHSMLVKEVDYISTEKQLYVHDFTNKNIIFSFKSCNESSQELQLGAQPLSISKGRLPFQSMMIEYYRVLHIETLVALSRMPMPSTISVWNLFSYWPLLFLNNLSFMHCFFLNFPDLHYFIVLLRNFSFSPCFPEAFH